MKSKYRKGDDTLGTQILKTQEKHERSDPILAMDLAHEGGKSYMRELIDVVENHRDLADEYYIHVFCTRERMFGSRTAIIFRFFARKTAPPMAPEQDLWYVCNSLEKLELLWSLPQSEMMPSMLKDDSLDPNLKKWIKIYLSP